MSAILLYLLGVVLVEHQLQKEVIKYESSLQIRVHNFVILTWPIMIFVAILYEFILGKQLIPRQMEKVE